MHSEGKGKQAKWATEVAIPPAPRFSQKQAHKVSNCEFHCFQSRKLKKKKSLVDILFLRMNGYFFRDEVSMLVKKYTQLLNQIQEKL